MFFFLFIILSTQHIPLMHVGTFFFFLPLCSVVHVSFSYSKNCVPLFFFSHVLCLSFFIFLFFFIEVLRWFLRWLVPSFSFLFVYPPSYPCFYLFFLWEDVDEGWEEGGGGGNKMSFRSSFLLLAAAWPGMPDLRGIFFFSWTITLYCGSSLLFIYFLFVFFYLWR